MNNVFELLGIHDKSKWDLKNIKEKIEERQRYSGVAKELNDAVLKRVEKHCVLISEIGLEEYKRRIEIIRFNPRFDIFDNELFETFDFKIEEPKKEVAKDNESKNVDVFSFENMELIDKKNNDLNFSGIPVIDEEPVNYDYSNLTTEKLVAIADNMSNDNLCEKLFQEYESSLDEVKEEKKEEKISIKDRFKKIKPKLVKGAVIGVGVLTVLAPIGVLKHYNITLKDIGPTITQHYYKTDYNTCVKYYVQDGDSYNYIETFLEDSSKVESKVQGPYRQGDYLYDGDVFIGRTTEKKAKELVEQGSAEIISYEEALNYNGHGAFGPSHEDYEKHITWYNPYNKNI